MRFLVGYLVCFVGAYIVSLEASAASINQVIVIRLSAGQWQDALGITDDSDRAIESALRKVIKDSVAGRPQDFEKRTFSEAAIVIKERGLNEFNEEDESFFTLAINYPAELPESVIALPETLLNKAFQFRIISELDSLSSKRLSGLYQSINLELDHTSIPPPVLFRIEQNIQNTWLSPIDFIASESHDSKRLDLVERNRARLALILLGLQAQHGVGTGVIDFGELISQATRFSSHNTLIISQSAWVSRLQDWGILPLEYKRIFVIDAYHGEVILLSPPETCLGLLAQL